MRAPSPRHPHNQAPTDAVPLPDQQDGATPAPERPSSERPSSERPSPERPSSGRPSPASRADDPRRRARRVAQGGPSPSPPDARPSTPRPVPAAGPVDGAEDSPYEQWLSPGLARAWRPDRPSADPAPEPARQDLLLWSLPAADDPADNPADDPADDPAASMAGDVVLYAPSAPTVEAAPPAFLALNHAPPTVPNGVPAASRDPIPEPSAGVPAGAPTEPAAEDAAAEDAAAEDAAAEDVPAEDAATGDAVDEQGRGAGKLKLPPFAVPELPGTFSLPLSPDRPGPGSFSPAARTLSPSPAPEHPPDPRARDGAADASPADPPTTEARTEGPVGEPGQAPRSGTPPTATPAGPSSTDRSPTRCTPGTIDSGAESVGSVAPAPPVTAAQRPGPSVSRPLPRGPLPGTRRPAGPPSRTAADRPWSEERWDKPRSDRAVGSRVLPPDADVLDGTADPEPPEAFVLHPGTREPDAGRADAAVLPAGLLKATVLASAADGATAPSRQEPENQLPEPLPIAVIPAKDLLRDAEPVVDVSSPPAGAGWTDLRPAALARVASERAAVQEPATEEQAGAPDERACGEAEFTTGPADPAGPTTDPARRAADPVRRTGDPVRRTADPAHRTADPVHRTADPVHRTADLARRAADPGVHPAAGPVEDPDPAAARAVPTGLTGAPRPGLPAGGRASGDEDRRAAASGRRRRFDPPLWTTAPPTGEIASTADRDEPADRTAAVTPPDADPAEDRPEPAAAPSGHPARSMLMPLPSAVRDEDAGGPDRFRRRPGPAQPPPPGLFAPDDTPEPVLPRTFPVGPDAPVPGPTPIDDDPFPALPPRLLPDPAGRAAQWPEQPGRPAVPPMTFRNPEPARSGPVATGPEPETAEPPLARTLDEAAGLDPRSAGTAPSSRTDTGPGPWADQAPGPATASGHRRHEARRPGGRSRGGWFGRAGTALPDTASPGTARPGTARPGTARPEIVTRQRLPEPARLDRRDGAQPADPGTPDLDDDAGAWPPRPTPAPRPGPLPRPSATVLDRVNGWDVPGRLGGPVRLGRPVRNGVGAVLVIAVALAAGLFTYRVVLDQRTPRQQVAVAPEPAASQAAQPPDAPQPAPRELPTTIADGDELRAAAPLNQVHQDQGSSIRLPGGRTLWIFADTFQTSKDPNFFVTSSAGLTDPAAWKLHYSQEGFSGGKHPVEFLPRTAVEKSDSRADDHYQAVWPTGSTRMPDGSILISYAKYRVMLRTKTYDFLSAGLFEFRYQDPRSFTGGARAKRIANDIWGPSDGEIRSPVQVEGQVYFSECQDLHCYSLRAPADRVADPASYTWWTGAGWSPERSRRAAMIVGSNHPGGNPSVVRLSTGVFGMADTEAGSVSTSGQLWVAPKPWGPWSKAASFAMERCPPPGCYGLNLHPEASTPSSLRVSYALGGDRPVVRVDDVPVTYGARGGWITTG